MTARPNPQLDVDRDWRSLHRINNYLYDEWRRENGRGPFLFLWDWKACRRRRQLGITLDVMHQLHKELHARGQLTSPTMFTPTDPAERAMEVER